MIQLPESALHLAIDDSTIVSRSDTQDGEEYLAQYRHVVETLGLRLKPHDPNLEKAFLPSHKGQVLGVEFDLPSRTWWAPQKKLNDLSQTLEDLVDMHNPANTKAFTVNTFEKCVGILDNFGLLSRVGRVLMLVPLAEMAFHLERFHKENVMKPERQTEYCTLSLHARTNILMFRALLVISPKFPLPMEDPRHFRQVSGAADFTIFTDASGKPKLITDPAYKATCLGAYWPATLANPTSRAYSFVLPYSFLVGRAISRGNGRQRCVMDQTALLELMPIIALILQHPRLFRGKSVTVIVDNQTTVNLFTACTAKKVYTAFFMECLFFVMGALNINLVMKWRRRRSTAAMVIADELTHGGSAAAGPEVVFQLLPLPPPLYKVVHATTSYHSHTLDTLRNEVRNYLQTQLGNVTFPFC